MTKLIIVRSGATDWNSRKRIQGSVDIPLNEEGITAASRMAEELKKFEMDVIFCSCLSRSRQTADIIAKEQGIKVKSLKELDEIDQGMWQGLCLGDIKKRYKKKYGMWKTSPFLATPPKGEEIKNAYDRAVSAVQKMLDNHKNETVCIVAHEVVIGLIKCHFSGGEIKNLWEVTPKIGTWEMLEIK